jgi:CheY-like chemotaxis protein
MPDTILLVDDNPDDIDLTMRSFREHHLHNRTVVANDGVEALDYLFGTGTHAGRDVHRLPKVVVLDLKMPRINGMDVLKKIRADERTRKLPVVIFTSADEDKEMTECYQNGCNSYVQKPVDMGQFMKASADVGVYWTVRNKPVP